jgi:hypothetical protein
MLGGISHNSNFQGKNCKFKHYFLLIFITLCLGRSVVGVPGDEDRLLVLRAHLHQHDRRVPARRQYGNIYSIATIDIL